MHLEKLKRYLSLTLAILMLLSVIPTQAFAEVINPGDDGEDSIGKANESLLVDGDELDVQLLWTIDAGNGTISTDTNTVALTAYGSTSDQYVSKAMLTNNSGSTAKLTFDYSAASYSSFTIDEQEIENGEGTHSVILNDDQTITVTITGADVSGGNASLTLNNFALAALSADAKLTVSYDSNLGSVTKGGSTIASGTPISNDIANGITLTAVANSSANFAGWINADTEELISSDATYTFYLTGDVNVRASFVLLRDPAKFTIGSGSTLYTLQEALAQVGTSSKTITLATSGVLEAGEYNIPSNVKLLIPYSASDDGNFVAPTGNEWSSPMATSTTAPGSSQSAFRTLTLERGAILNVSGQLNVNSAIYAKNGNYTGLPTGVYGHIELESGSAINVKSSGKLYAYGYITGDGVVTAESGSYTYEIFQMTGWRGGTITNAWRNKSGLNAFAFNDYAIQNIEADFVINYGATASAVGSITVEFFGLTTKCKTIDYIGSNSGLIRLSEGASVHRSFAPETGRVKYAFNGDASVASINVSISVGSYNFVLNSAEKVLAIPYYWDFVVESGTVTLVNDYKLLPGASLTVEQGAKAVIGANSELYIYDTADYVGKGYVSSNSIPVRYVATTGATAGSLPKMNRSTPSGQVVVNGTLQIDGAIYTTENGGTSVDKVLKGSGKIINNSAATTPVTNVLDEFTYVDDAIVDHNIRVVPVVGQIGGASAGSDYHSFAGAGAVYYGTGDGYWYQHVVSANAFENIRNFKNMSAEMTAGVNRSRSVIQNGSKINYVLGFISDYLNIEETVNEETGEVTGYTSSVVTTPFTFAVPARTEVETDNGTLSGAGTAADPFVLTLENGNAVLTTEATVAGDGELLMEYDDHLDISGYETVEIVDAGTPTSYQVGYGIEENSALDTAVIAIENNYLVATGIGTATVRLDGAEYTVEVIAAPISMLFLGGQSNMQGSRGDGKQSIAIPEGQSYLTYGERYSMTASNATTYAPSALTGALRDTNVEGTTSGLSMFPVNSLEKGVATDDTYGKDGPDSGFAYQWIESTGEKVWVINAAHGGSSLASWLDGGANHEEAVLLFKACQETMRKEIAAGHYTLSHMGFYWCQGETDCTNTAEYYATNFLKMYESMKTELSADMDSDPSTPDQTIEFTNIVLTFAGSMSSVGYRYDAEEGLYVAGDNSGWRTHEELEMRGQRVAQLWLGANPDYPDINVVCNIADGWYTMPDGAEIPNGTLSVSDYFAKHYEGGVIDYPVQTEQTDAWKAPDGPEDVRCTATDGAGRLHYNQRGFNEVGREAVRNTMILLGYAEDPVDVETEVTFYDWTGFREVESVKAATEGQSSTLVVPVVSPIYRSKDVTYTTSDGLDYVYYDLIAEGRAVEGTLQAKGANVATVDVIGRELGEFRWDFEGNKFVSSGPVENEAHYISGAVSNGVFENVQAKLEDAVVLKRDQNWLVEIKMVNTWTKAVTKILADNGGARADGDVSLAAGTDSILFSYYDGGHENYGASGLMEAGDTTPHTFRLYNVVNAGNGGNQIYVTVDGGDPIAMNNAVNGQDFSFAYIGTISTEYPLTGGYIDYIYIKETGAAADMHIHQWSEWEVTTEPTYNTAGEQTRECVCGEKETVQLPAQYKYIRYRWELNDDGSELESVTPSGFTENELTNKVGSITKGVTKGLQYKFATPVVLKKDQNWTVEWEMSGSTTAWQKILVAQEKALVATDYCIMVRGEALSLGKYTSTHYNYNVPAGVAEAGISLVDLHKYKLENRIDDEGNNAVHLWVDDVDYGALTNSTLTWLSNDTITFNYIGQQDKYTLTGAKINYIEVQESGANAVHTYDAGVVTTQPTCTAEGVKTYTCTACGISYTEPVDKIAHVYDSAPVWTWTGDDENGYTAATATFSCECGDGQTVDAVITDEVTVEPTEETEGTKVYTATATNNETAYTDTKTVVLPALGEPIIYDKYRWELQNDALVSVTTDGFIENALEDTQTGTITDGVTSNAQYKITTPVVLEPTKSWAVEWEMSGVTDSWQKLLATNASRETGDISIMMKSSGIYIGHYKYSSTLKKTTHINHTPNELAALGIDLAANHTYRLENRINQDGTNMIYLLIDGKEIGAMDYDSTHVQADTTWAAQSVTFNYIGQTNYPLNGAAIEYIEVSIEHTEHVWSEIPAWIWTGDDENGYTAATATFSCECGEEQTVDAVITDEVTVEPTETTEGTKVYTATVVFNEETYIDKKTVTIEKETVRTGTWYRWQLNDGEDELVSVTTNGYSENALTDKVGTISGGVTNNLQYKFTTPVVLDYTKPWSVEWVMTGSIDTWQKILVAKRYNQTANDFCLMVTGEKNVTLSKVLNNTHNNYTAGELSSSDINMKTGTYKYRLENVYNEDGTNTIYLYIEDVLIGAMDDIASDKTEWINNATITFNYIGTQNKYQLNGATIDYIEVYLGDAPAENEDHTHSYGSPEFIWNTEGDPATCTATFTCTVCAEGTTGRVEIKVCSVEETFRVEETCAANGSVTYTATVDFGGKNYTDIETVTLAATGAHSYTGEWDITDDGHARKCSNCDAVDPNREAHADENTKDHKCDTCEYVMSTCANSEKTTEYAPVDGTETHTVTETCNVCGQQVGDVTTESCADENSDGKCDLCEGDMAADIDVVYGDVTGDNSITMQDVSSILKYINGGTFTDEQITAADVSGDGSVTMNDISYMLKYINGAIKEFPVEENK